LFECIIGWAPDFAEDGQLYIMDPQYVDMQTNSKHNSAQLDALQGFEQNILKHHERFTDKTLNRFQTLNFDCFLAGE
jgi:hypothetical protein